MDPIIRTDNLSVGYEKKTVIENVDINALRGQTICLMGPNGAGKSTILRTLSGMLAPVEGCVYIGGEEFDKVKAHTRARQMAVVLTEKINMNMTTVFEIAAMGRIPYTGFLGRLTAQDKEIVWKCLRTVGAEGLALREFASLSDGEKQKVLIARALAQEPKLIILDEPTSHLDIKHKIEVIRILNQLALENGLTVILALHDIDIAVKFCQVVLMVKDGKVVAQGRPEDIVQRDTVDDLYSITGAFYDSILGSVEICNEAAPEVFVAAGAGSGIPVYRIVSRLGYGIVTGILTENDIDYSVASAMKLTIVSEPSFQPFGRTRVLEAEMWMRKCRVLIDAGFPLGQTNQENIGLLKQMAKEGRKVLSFRAEEDRKKIYGDCSSVATADSMGDLEEWVLKHPGEYKEEENVFKNTAGKRQTVPV